MSVSTIARSAGPARLLPALAGAIAVVLALACPAHALQPQAARRHVEATIDEIIRLIVDNPPRAETAQRLLDIVERRASVAAIARFAAGRAWRTMTEAQQAAFTRAFSHRLANVYAGYFRHYDGDVSELRRHVRILGTADAGAKGVLVQTEIVPDDGRPVSIDWLVSDRTGRIAVADLIVEGVSMAITQREIVGSMLDARDGDVARLVSDLENEAIILPRTDQAR